MRARSRWPLKCTLAPWSHQRKWLPPKTSSLICPPCCGFNSCRLLQNYQASPVSVADECRLHSFIHRLGLIDFAARRSTLKSPALGPIAPSVAILHAPAAFVLLTAGGQRRRPGMGKSGHIGGNHRPRRHPGSNRQPSFLSCIPGEAIHGRCRHESPATCRAGLSNSSETRRNSHIFAASTAVVPLIAFNRHSYFVSWLASPRVHLDIKRDRLGPVP